MPTTWITCIRLWRLLISLNAPFHILTWRRLASIVLFNLSTAAAASLWCVRHILLTTHWKGMLCLLDRVEWHGWFLLMGRCRSWMLTKIILEVLLGCEGVDIVSLRGGLYLFLELLCVRCWAELVGPWMATTLRLAGRLCLRSLRCCLLRRGVSVHSHV